MLTRKKRLRLLLTLLVLLTLPVLVKGILCYCDDYIRPFGKNVGRMCHYVLRAWERWVLLGETNTKWMIGAAGVLTIILVVKVMLRCLPQKQKLPTSHRATGYLSDAPVLSLAGDEGDKLDRRAYVDGLAKLIKYGPCDKQAMFIAIYGAWGDGKTSVRNMVEETLNNDETRVSFVDFSPWKYSSGSDLQSVFFENLSDHLSKCGEHDTAKSCRRFSWALGARNLDKNVGSIHWLVDITRGMLFDVMRTEEDLRIALRKILSESGRRIVVVVDDLERLPEDQVCEVIRFLKANADLPGIIYLVLSDERYLTGAVASIIPSSLEGNVNCGREFLEKIFTFRMDLPPINERQLMGLLKGAIENVLARNNIDKRDELDAEYELGSYVDNMRKLKRVINSFIVDIEVAKSKLSGHVYLNRHIGDMLALVVLRLKMPDAYNRLRMIYWKVVNAYSPFEEMIGIPESYIRDLSPKFSTDELAFLNAFMERRLGIVYNADKKMYSVSHPDASEKVLKYRLASAFNFDEYFLFTKDERVISEDDKVRFLRAIEEGVYPESLIKRFDDDGSLSKLLYALEAQDTHADKKVMLSYLHTLVKLSSEKLNSALIVQDEASYFGGQTSIYTRVVRCVLRYLERDKKRLMSGDVSEAVRKDAVGGVLMPSLRDIPNDLLMLALLLEHDAVHHKSADVRELDELFSKTDYEEMVKLFLDRIPDFTSRGDLFAHPEFFRIFRTWLFWLKKKNEEHLFKAFRKACLTELEGAKNVCKIIPFFAIDNTVYGSISDQLEVEVKMEMIEQFFGKSGAEKILTALKKAEKLDLYSFHFFLSLRWAIKTKKVGLSFSDEEQKKFLLGYIGTSQYIEERKSRVDESIGKVW